MFPDQVGFRFPLSEAVIVRIDGVCLGLGEFYGL